MKYFGIKAGEYGSKGRRSAVDDEEHVFSQLVDIIPTRGPKKEGLSPNLQTTLW